MKLYNDIEQGTDEWLRLRAGKFTASLDFQQLVSGRADTYRKLIRKKSAEKITGQLITTNYSNSNIERGNELEDQAVEAFEMQTGLIVSRVGFAELSEWVGSSPDGLIGDDCGIEIKCKDIHTHLDCFIDGYDKSYNYQIQGNMFVTGRKSWWFVSYNPHYVHINKHLYFELIQRDEAMINKILEGTKKGIEDVKKTIELLGA